MSQEALETRRPTFRQVALEWLDSKRVTLRRSTLCAYSLELKTRLLPFFGDSERVTGEDARRYVALKTADGLALKTVRDSVAVLRQVCKYGARRGKFPAADWEVEYPRPRAPRQLPTLTLARHRRLQDFLEGDPTPATIGVTLALATGMRIGEVCGLRWECVDLRQRVIRVVRTAYRVYDCELGRTERLEGEPKTLSGWREVPVSPGLARCLSAARRAQAPGAAYVVGRGDKAKDTREYRDYFYRLMRRLGIPRIPFHGLRHTFATRCVEAGCDPKTLSAMLGHSKVSTTLDLYVHPDMDQKRRCLRRMLRRLGGGG